MCTSLVLLIICLYDAQTYGFSKWFVIQCRHSTWDCKSWGHCTSVSAFLGLVSSAYPKSAKLEREPGTNDCEPNALAITLAGLILKGSLNISTMWYSARIRRWILQVTDRQTECRLSSGKGVKGSTSMFSFLAVVHLVRWMLTLPDESRSNSHWIFYCFKIPILVT